MKAHSIALALLAVGCTPEPAVPTPLDMGDMAGAPALVDLAQLAGDMAAGVCQWEVQAPPISAGSMPVSSAFVLGGQQCLVLTDALYITRRRADRTEEQFYFYPDKATPNGIGVFYRSIGDRATLPEITCEKWDGTATITVTPDGRQVAVNLSCSEANAGHHFWSLDMTPPETLLRGTFTFPR